MSRDERARPEVARHLISLRCGTLRAIVPAMKLAAWILALATLLGACAPRNKPPAHLTPAQECRRQCEDAYFSCSQGCGAAEQCLLMTCASPRTACLEKCPKLQP